MGRFSEGGDAVGSPRPTKPRGNIVVIAVVYIAIQVAILWIYVGALQWAKCVINTEHFVGAIQSQVLALITSLAALVFARQAIDHIYAGKAALAGVIVGVALTCGNALVPFFHENHGSILDVLLSVHKLPFWCFAAALTSIALFVGCFEFTKERLGEAAERGWRIPCSGYYVFMVPCLLLLIAIRVYFDIDAFIHLDDTFAYERLQTTLERGNVVADLVFSAPPSTWNIIHTVWTILFNSIVVPLLAWLSLTPTPPRQKRIIVIGFIFGIWYWTGKK